MCRMLTLSPAWSRLVEVTLLMVQRDFRGRYKHTRVGMLWAILNPLMFLSIFYFVFKLVLGIGIPDYASFVFTGILAWNWCQSSLIQASTSISSHPGLVGQPGFPTASLPVVSVLSSLLNLSLSLPVLALLLVLEGAHTSWAVLSLPLVLLAQLLLILALAYVVAALNVRFRDVEHILPIILQLGYYVTPIFYDVSRIGPEYRWVFALNPIYHFVDAYRSALIHGRMPDLVPILLIAVASLVLLRLGHGYFERARYRFLEQL